MTIDRIRQELNRLNGTPNSEPLSGVGAVRFLVRCPLGAGDVLDKAKTVLEIVDRCALGSWTYETIWPQILPNWFVEACSPPLRPEEAESWLKWWQRLSPQDQSEAETTRGWSLDNWLYWMEPENRQWTLWDAQIATDSDDLIVAVQVECWPFPWGSLRWLFKASGASAVEPEA